MLIGYARVSTNEQDPRLQIGALEEAGCKRIFVDEGVSGSAVVKPQLNAALAAATGGADTLIVWKLDRLSRSTRDLIEIVESLRKREIGLRSLKESVIDTTTPTGNLVFQIFSVIAEYERKAIHERTMAGLTAAKKAGVKFGRPRSIDDRQWHEARKLLDQDPPHSVAAVATLLGVSRQAIYRRIEADRASAPENPA